MDQLIVTGSKTLSGTITVSGAKNVAMKVLLAGLLTDKAIHIANVPLISSVFGTAEIVKHLGVKVRINSDHTMRIKGDGKGDFTVPLELGGLYRTATMTLGPLLARFGRAVVPNPGGCRLGKRPIDQHVEGLTALGAKIEYKDGFFHASTHRLKGTRFRFSRNTHTGTETLILGAVLADGETVLENAAAEPEVDDLLALLNSMGAKIRRIDTHTIVITGVKKLQGASHTIMTDRNEVVTFAVGAIASGGEVIVQGTQRLYLKSFLEALDASGGGWEALSEHSTRFFAIKKIKPTHIVTGPHPGFMTDWQAPWALLMTQADGESHIHETVFENRFGYVRELHKMGADIQFFQPEVTDPQEIYNFQLDEKAVVEFQAIRIRGKTKLHNGVVEVSDLRAGATLLLAAIIANGESVVRGVEHIDRGYEQIEKRLIKLGAKIVRIKEA